MSSSMQPANTNGAPPPSRRQQIEDFAGRTLLMVWWSGSLLIQTRSLIGQWSRSDGALGQSLGVAHLVLLITFTALAAWLTIIRQPAKAVAGGVEARVVAILGTFMVFTLPLLPSVSTPIDLQVAALPITLAGLLASVYCLAWLGRSFSIMATARNLVTSGPYRVVRHPLYGAEMIMILGLCLWSLSVASVLLFLAILAMQLRRTHHEEKVLRAAFPEYEDYARRVPRIIPGYLVPYMRSPASPKPGTM